MTKDFAAMGKRALDTMSPEARARRARLAADARWKRLRGEDAITDRSHRMHSALDRLIDMAGDDTKLQDKIEKALDSGNLLRALDRQARLHQALDTVLDSRERREQE
jgi:hypothetical protein